MNSPKDATLLIHELSRRFPLLEQITGRFGENVPREQIPWFIGLLMAAATVPE